MKKKYTWREAFEDSHQAALRGDPGGQNFAGFCYDTGQGVRRNPKKAKYWYEKAARQGNIHAIFNLALVYDFGRRGVRRNASKAARLYRQAALLDDVRAQNNLSSMLRDGDGVKKDVAAGLQWLRRAARRGDSKAQYNLGRAYLDGDDVRQNDIHAKTWLTKAARNGHAQARRLLKSRQFKLARSV